MHVSPELSERIRQMRSKTWLGVFWIIVFAWAGIARGQEKNIVLDPPFDEITTSSLQSGPGISGQGMNGGIASNLEMAINPGIGVVDEFAPSVWQVLANDQRNFYSIQTLGSFSVALGSNAILANTSLDQKFADWYQDSVRGGTSDGLADVAKIFGEQWPMVGAFAGASVVGRLSHGHPYIQIWGDRSLRSMLVGVPPLLVLQNAIGSSRPSDLSASSNWDFWGDDNGASGHAFVGAVPFLVAAQLTERPIYRATLLFASTLPGWSRVNDDAHYLSQVIVGWWIAYAATNAVRQTDFDTGFEIRPIMIGNSSGLGLSWRY